MFANAMEQPQSASDKAQHRACDPCSNALSLSLSLSLSVSLSSPFPSSPRLAYLPTTYLPT